MADEKQSTTCLGMITAGNIRVECVTSLMDVFNSKAARWVFFHKSGPMLDDARNALIQKFYDPAFADCDRLLMVDSDVEFSIDDVRQLEADDLPVVAGYYIGGFGDRGFCPVVYEWFQREDGWRSMHAIQEWPDGVPAMWTPGEEPPQVERPLVSVDAVGAGFLMVKREVLTQLFRVYGIPCPWFAEEIRGGMHYGEDLTFCQRLTDCGFPIYVDRRVRVTHYKEIPLG